MKTVNVVFGNNLIGVPWFVGVDKGIWVKRGLDVRAKQLVQGSDQVNALQAKEADFGYQVNGALLPALEQGLQVIVIASAVGDATRNFADDAFTLIGGPKVKTIADVKGKKVGMVAQGTSPPFLRSILSKNGMTYDQVEIINVPQANHPQALATGQIDALVTIEPYGVMALDATKDSTLLVRGGGNVSFAGTMVTRPDVIAADPDTVQKMVDGFAEAAAFVRQNPNEAVAVASRWISGLDQNATQRAIKYMYYDPRVSTFTKEGLEADMKALLDARTLKAPIDLAKYMNLTYINKTIETHPEFFSDLKPAPVLR
jgi:ABC-type nitrate/sulfonate/bicarbonate transport system substrate-binding protein